MILAYCAVEVLVVVVVVVAAAAAAAHCSELLELQARRAI
jgi:hypothetical protein